MEAGTQLLANGLVAGSLYGLVALSFALIYNTGHFFHFAHGAVYTAAAYFAYALVTDMGLAAPLAALLGAALLGAGMELLVYRPLRARGAPPAVLLMASLGLATVVQNCLAMAFGEGVKTIPHTEAAVLTIAGARLTPHQILVIVLCSALGAAVLLALHRTGVGRTLRAVADDAELATVHGIDGNRVLLVSFVLGSVLTGTAGVLVAYDVGLWPTMGISPLLAGVVGMIVGGAGNSAAAFLGGLVVGMAQQAAAWVIPSKWQDTIVFVILIILLLVRPYGIWGSRLRTMVA